MNTEGYRDPTAEQAIKEADRKTAAEHRVFEGWVPPPVWKFLKPVLLVLDKMEFSATVIVTDNSTGFSWRIRSGKRRK